MRPIKIELHRGIDKHWQHGVTTDVWRWRWTARRGGRIIAASSEAYTERIRAVDNIALVFGIPLRRLVKPGARSIDVAWQRLYIGYIGHGGTTIEVKTR